MCLGRSSFKDLQCEFPVLDWWKESLLSICGIKFWKVPPYFSFYDLATSDFMVGYSLILNARTWASEDIMFWMKINILIFQLGRQ